MPRETDVRANTWAKFQINLVCAPRDGTSVKYGIGARVKVRLYEQKFDS